MFKNNEEANLLVIAQGEVNVTNIVFKIAFAEIGVEENEVNLDDYIAIIQFKDDYLTNIPKTNLLLEKEDANFKITWTIGKAITLQAKEREFQVILKNEKTNKIFKSYKNILKINKSIKCDNSCNDSCDTTCIAGYLEQFAIKINTIIENGVGDFVATIEFNRLKDTVEKLEQEVAQNKQNITDLQGVKAEISNKLDINTYNTDKQFFASTQDLNAKANTDDVYSKTETYNKEEIDQKIQDIDIKDQLTNLATKEELSQKADITALDLKQPITDNSLNTTSKTIVGAINELKTNIDSGSSSPDLSNYYDKGQVDNLLGQKADRTSIDTINSNLDLKQNKIDDGLNTSDKTIVGAINEVNRKAVTGQEVDLSNYYDKGTVDNKLSEKVSNDQFTQLQSTVNNKQNSTDNNLQTTAKNIVEAINEVNAKTSSGGGTTIDDTTPSAEKVYSSQKVQNELDLKVNSSEYNAKIEELQPKTDPLLTTDSKDIVQAINSTYELAKQASGGSSSVDVIKTTINDAAIVGEQQLASFQTSTGGYWSGGNVSANKTDFGSGYAVFRINKPTNQSTSGVLFKVNISFSGADKTYQQRDKAASASANITIGAYAGQEGVKRSISLNSISSSGGATIFDYSNGSAEYYLTIPELNEDIPVYLNIYGSQYLKRVSCTISFQALENIDYNFFIKNKDLSSVYFFNAGKNRNNLNISNNIMPIIYPESVYENISYGNNILLIAGSKGTDYRSSQNVSIGSNIFGKLEKGQLNIGIGNYLFNEAMELNYCTISGAYLNEDKSSSYPNYRYIKKLQYAINLGYGNKFTDQSTNEIIIGNSANGNGDNTLTLGNSSLTGIYSQVSAITQSCDPRLKENIEDVDVAQVIDALMQIKVIRASYRNLEEFKGSNENDKHKLMWDANNMGNIPLFAKDVKAQDMIITPLNENGEYLKTRTVTVIEQQPVSTLNEDGEEHIQLVDVEVEKEIPETETIEECKEFTPNQIMQSLVVGFQEQQRMILELQNEIRNLKGGF